jgi:hypothetical protein
MTVTTGQKWRALGIGTLVAIGASACSSSSSGGSPTAATSAASSPAASASPSGAQAAVLAVWQGYVSTLTTMYNQADPSLAAWNSYAALDAATAGTNAVVTFRAHGEIVPGAPKVSDVNVTAVNASGNPPNASLTACWDTRDFQPVFRSTGKSAAPPGETPAPPHVAEVTLQQFSYGWRVITFSISDQSC